MRKFSLVEEKVTDIIQNDKKAELIMPCGDDYRLHTSRFKVPLNYIAVCIFKNKELYRTFFYDAKHYDENQPRFIVCIHKRKNVYFMEKDGIELAIGKDFNSDCSIAIYCQTCHSAQLISATDGERHIEVLDSYDFFEEEPMVTQKTFELLLNISSQSKSISAEKGDDVYGIMG